MQTTHLKVCHFADGALFHKGCEAMKSLTYSGTESQVIDDERDSHWTD